MPQPLQKTFAINHLALIAASGAVGSGSVTQPKRVSNRKIKGYLFMQKINLEFFMKFSIMYLNKRIIKVRVEQIKKQS